MDTGYIQLHITNHKYNMHNASTPTLLLTYMFCAFGNHPFIFKKKVFFYVYSILKTFLGFIEYCKAFLKLVPSILPHSHPCLSPAQAPEKFLSALAVLGAAWQSRSHFNPKFTFFGELLQKPGVRFRIQFLKLQTWKTYI